MPDEPAQTVDGASGDGSEQLQEVLLSTAANDEQLTGQLIESVEEISLQLETLPEETATALVTEMLNREAELEGEEEESAEDVTYTVQIDAAQVAAIESRLSVVIYTQAVSVFLLAALCGFLLWRSVMGGRS